MDLSKTKTQIVGFFIKTSMMTTRPPPEINLVTLITAAFMLCFCLHICKMFSRRPKTFLKQICMGSVSRANISKINISISSWKWVSLVLFSFQYLWKYNYWANFMSSLLDGSLRWNLDMCTVRNFPHCNVSKYFSPKIR